MKKGRPKPLAVSIQQSSGHKVVGYERAAKTAKQLYINATMLIPDLLPQKLTLAGIDMTSSRDLALRRLGWRRGIRVGRNQYRTPKRDLVAVTQVALQNRRLRIGGVLLHADTLRGEFESFRVKISLSGRDSYEAGTNWRNNPHDDLLLAVTMGVWLGEERARSGPLASSSPLEAFFD